MSQSMVWLFLSVMIPAFPVISTAQAMESEELDYSEDSSEEHRNIKKQVAKQMEEQIEMNRDIPMVYNESTDTYGFSSPIALIHLPEGYHKKQPDTLLEKLQDLKKYARGLRLNQKIEEHIKQVDSYDRKASTLSNRDTLKDLLVYSQKPKITQKIEKLMEQADQEHEDRLYEITTRPSFKDNHDIQFLLQTLEETQYQLAVAKYNKDTPKLFVPEINCAYKIQNMDRDLFLTARDFPREIVFSESPSESLSSLQQFQLIPVTLNSGYYVIYNEFLNLFLTINKGLNFFNAELSLPLETPEDKIPLSFQFRFVPAQIQGENCYMIENRQTRNYLYFSENSHYIFAEKDTGKTQQFFRFLRG